MRSKVCRWVAFLATLVFAFTLGWTVSSTRQKGRVGADAKVGPPLTYEGIQTYQQDRAAEPEVLFATYRPQAGMEAALRAALRQKWLEYQKRKAVVPGTHYCVEVLDANARSRFVEICLLVGPHALEHAPDSLESVWGEIRALCEGHEDGQGVQYESARLVAPWNE